MNESRTPSPTNETLIVKQMTSQPIRPAQTPIFEPKQAVPAFQPKQAAQAFQRKPEALAKPQPTLAEEFIDEWAAF